MLDPSSQWYETIMLSCSQYLDNLEALEICGCGLPWDVIIESGLYGVTTSPNCGCGYGLNAEAGNVGLGVLEGCHSGGRTMMVFFSIMIGGFAAGQIGPGVKAMAEARIAAAKMLAVINRTPTIGGEEHFGNKKMEKKL